MRKDIRIQGRGQHTPARLALPAGLAHGQGADRRDAAWLRLGEGNVPRQVRRARRAKSGIASLVYDHRCFGANDGGPRQELDRLMQIRDWRDAISFVETLPETDTARIGIFGTRTKPGSMLRLPQLT